MNTSDSLIRCGWAGPDQIYLDYHDTEWGVPELDDQRLFEKLILDGAQAGLSWITILKKRDGYRNAFAGFDPEVIAAYGEKDVARLMQDASIVRNRQKIEAAIANAKAYLVLKEEGRSFSEYLWQFTDGKTLQNERTALKQIPASTPESEKMSKALRARGFKFVGPTICYAFMQAVGIVNDHLTTCFRHEPVKQLSKH